MRALNNYARPKAHRVRGFGAMVSLGLLAACSTGNIFSGGAERGTSGGTARMPSEVLDAVCEGRADEAVKLLTSEPLASPADRFFVALAVDEGGHAARSRMLYVNVMQTGSTDRVKVACGRRVLADGTVSGEAARRLAAVARDLAALDANLRPPAPLHRGLPASGPVFSASGGGASQPNANLGPARAVNKPGSQNPLGQWFAHLASYRSIENAQKNRSTLETQFPSLSGIIDQWEVDVGGLAIRLGVRMNSQSEAQQLCSAVKSQGAYCSVMDTSQ